MGNFLFFERSEAASVVCEKELIRTGLFTGLLSVVSSFWLGWIIITFVWNAYLLWETSQSSNEFKRNMIPNMIPVIIPNI